MSRKQFIIGGTVRVLGHIFLLGVLWAWWQESILFEIKRLREDMEND